MNWEEDESAVIYKMSFLEVAMVFATDGKRWVPMPHSTRPRCWQDRDAFNFNEPNLGALVRLAKAFFAALDRSFSLSVTWCKDINLTFLRVHPPQDGLILAVSPVIAEQSMDNLRGFTKRRPIRRANDLARPVRA